MSYDNFSNFKAITDAYNLCKESGFVKEVLDKEKKRDLFLPELPDEKPQFEYFKKYIELMSGKILFLNKFPNDKEPILSNDILEKTKKLIPKYFPGTEANQINTLAIISLAILKWLIDRERVSIGIMFKPSAKSKDD